MITWLEVDKKKKDGQDLSALEMFILAFEPMWGDTDRFRKGLSDAISEAKQETLDNVIAGVKRNPVTTLREGLEAL